MVDAAVQAQGHTCIYCQLPFGTVVYWPGHGSVVQSAVGDHFDPWSTGGSTDAENIVAACTVCNQLKNAVVFESVASAWDFISRRRDAKHVRVAFVPSRAITNNPERWAREYARWLSASLPR